MRCVTIGFSYVNANGEIGVWNNLDLSLLLILIKRCFGLIDEQLLWIILVASCAALVIQSLAANLGLVTGLTLNSKKKPFFYSSLYINLNFGQICLWNADSMISGKHLAEHCRAEYSKVPNFMLWVVAEIAVVACDIPEGMRFFLMQWWFWFHSVNFSTKMLISDQSFGLVCIQLLE